MTTEMTATAKVVDLVHEICAMIHPQMRCDKCSRDVNTVYGAGHPGCYLIAEEVIAKVRSSPADARVVTPEMRQAALDAMVAEQKIADAEGWSDYNRAQRYLDVALEAAERARPLSVDPMQQIIAAVRAYLPPDGITKDELVSRIIGIVDPGE